MGGDWGLDYVGGNTMETKGHGAKEKLTKTWKLERKSKGRGRSQRVFSLIQGGPIMIRNWEARRKNQLKERERNSSIRPLQWSYDFVCFSLTEVQAMYRAKK